MLSDTPAGTGSVTWGQVKWYDATKGYGFVIPDDGGPDIMVHASCVRAFGRAGLPEGSRVRLVVGRGQRGLAAQEILEIREPETFSPAAPSVPGFAESPRPTDLLGQALELSPLLPARVKWFDKQKGFGFVNVFGKPEDVFVHMETVRRSGFHDLSSGEAVAVRTCRGPRGLMVAELRLWESGAQGPED